METSYDTAHDEFEAWVGTMPAPMVDDPCNQNYTVVYGLVIVGVFLLANPRHERHRSELMSVYGNDWFILDAEKWRGTKDYVYAAA